MERVTLPVHVNRLQLVVIFWQQYSQLSACFSLKKGNTKALQKRTRNRAQKQLGKKNIYISTKNQNWRFVLCIPSYVDDTGGLPSDENSNTIELHSPK